MDQGFAQIADESFDIPVSGFAYTVPAFNRLDLVRVEADVIRPFCPNRRTNPAAAAATSAHCSATMTAAIAQYEKKQQKEQEAVHPKIKHGLNSRTIPCAGPRLAASSG
jgi:hypothetical protein